MLAPPSHPVQTSGSVLLRPLPSTLLPCPQASGDLHPHAQEVQHAARKYLDQHLWDVYYKGAYLKLVTSFATWSPAASCNPYTIYGNECPSGTVIDPTCAYEASTLRNNCKSCNTGGPRVVGALRNRLSGVRSASGADGGVRFTMQPACQSRCQPSPVPPTCCRRRLPLQHLLPMLRGPRRQAEA